MISAAGLAVVCMALVMDVRAGGQFTQQMLSLVYTANVCHISTLDTMHNLEDVQQHCAGAKYVSMRNICKSFELQPQDIIGACKQH